VGIGGALAEARTAAGLTIAQVSERTRVRETIIRDIERDDYSACGGDYYARGHIRAIARVVGADPVPLIKEYDALHMPPPEPVEPEDHADGPGWRFPGWQRILGADASATGLDASTHGGNAHAGHAGVGDDPDTSPELDDPGILGFRTARPTSAGVPGGITAAEAFRPRMSVEAPRVLARRTMVLALALFAVIGVLIYLLVSGGSSPSPSLTSRHNRAHHPAGSGVTTHRSKSTATSSSSATPSSSTTPLASAVPLAPVSAAAFGPGGVSTGDDPQEASLAIDSKAGTAWRSDWYATANLGGLQSGTGLLLDMGKRVTVTSARILLGPAGGGRLELRAGNTPALADLQVVAQAHLPGGPVTVPIGSPVTGRYLLIWFTRLPPDNSGTYQASISSVTLSGTT
jgi:transcriptional regulator with XRE-family HTH domain